MPYKMKTTDGKEIDVVTMDEHNAALTARETSIRSELTTTLTAKEKELADAKVELSKLQAKDANFAIVKDKADKLEAELKTIKDGAVEAEKTRVTNTRNAIFDRLSGGNKVLREKIEKEYGAFALPETTEAEITERAKKALYVAAPSDAPKAIDAFMASTGGRGTPPAGTAVSTEPPPETPEQAAVRRKMGITDEDYKKYGARAAAKK
jgi:uncharacterized protein YdcH (DUF465 family)